MKTRPDTPRPFDLNPNQGRLHLNIRPIQSSTRLNIQPDSTPIPPVRVDSFNGNQPSLTWDSAYDHIPEQTPRRMQTGTHRSIFSPDNDNNASLEQSMSRSEIIDQLSFTPGGVNRSTYSIEAHSDIASNTEILINRGNRAVKIAKRTPPFLANNSTNSNPEVSYQSDFARELTSQRKLASSSAKVPSPTEVMITTASSVTNRDCPGPRSMSSPKLINQTVVMSSASFPTSISSTETFPHFTYGAPRAYQSIFGDTQPTGFGGILPKTSTNTLTRNFSFSNPPNTSPNIFQFGKDPRRSTNNTVTVTSNKFPISSQPKSISGLCGSKCGPDLRSQAVVTTQVKPGHNSNAQSIYTGISMPRPNVTDLPASNGNFFDPVSSKAVTASNGNFTNPVSSPASVESEVRINVPSTGQINPAQLSQSNGEPNVSHSPLMPDLTTPPPLLPKVPTQHVPASVPNTSRTHSRVSGVCNPRAGASSHEGAPVLGLNPSEPIGVHPPQRGVRQPHAGRPDNGVPNLQTGVPNLAGPASGATVSGVLPGSVYPPNPGIPFHPGGVPGNGVPNLHNGVPAETATDSGPNQSQFVPQQQPGVPYQYGVPVTSVCQSQTGVTSRPPFQSNSLGNNSQNGAQANSVPGNSNQSNNVDMRQMAREVAALLSLNNATAVSSSVPAVSGGSSGVSASAGPSSSQNGAQANSISGNPNQNNNVDMSQLAREVAAILSLNNATAVSGSGTAGAGVSAGNGVSDSTTTSTGASTVTTSSSTSGVQSGSFNATPGYNTFFSGDGNTLNSTQGELSENERTMLLRSGVTRSDLDNRAAQLAANSSQVLNAPVPQIVYTASQDSVFNFTGFMEDYELWRSQVMAYIVSIPESMRFTTLSNKLPNNLRNKISRFAGFTQQAFESALRHLDKMFDNPAMVVQILSDQIRAELDHSCSYDDGKFSDMVAKVRSNYDRILKISPLSITNLNAYVTQFMSSLPAEPNRKAIKIRYYNSSEFTFNKLLQIAEEYDALLLSKRTGAENRSFNKHPNSFRSNSHDRNSSKGFNNSRSNSHDRGSNKPFTGSRSGSFDRNSKPHHNNASSHIHAISNEGDSQAPNTEQVMAVKGSIQPTSDAPRSRSRSRSSVRSNAKSPFRKAVECLLCQKDGHYTVDCKSDWSNAQLKELIEAYRICTYCGVGGHETTKCHAYLRGFSSDKICDNASRSCRDDPHSKRFCSLYKQD